MTRFIFFFFFCCCCKGFEQLCAREAPEEVEGVDAVVAVRAACCGLAVQLVVTGGLGALSAAARTVAGGIVGMTAVSSTVDAVVTVSARCEVASRVGGLEAAAAVAAGSARCAVAKAARGGLDAVSVVAAVGTT
jgi:hypothetical protein